MCSTTLCCVMTTTDDGHALTGSYGPVLVYDKSTLKPPEGNKTCHKLIVQLSSVRARYVSCRPIPAFKGSKW